MSLAMLMAITFGAFARQTVTGTGLTSAPSKKKALANAHRLENPRQGVGRANCKIERAALQPDLMARADLGRDRREGDRQVFDSARP